MSFRPLTRFDPLRSARTAPAIRQRGRPERPHREPRREPVPGRRLPRPVRAVLPAGLPRRQRRRRGVPVPLQPAGLPLARGGRLAGCVCALFCCRRFVSGSGSGSCSLLLPCDTSRAARGLSSSGRVAPPARMYVFAVDAFGSPVHNINPRPRQPTPTRLVALSTLPLPLYIALLLAVCYRSFAWTTGCSRGSITMT